MPRDCRFASRSLNRCSYLDTVTSSSGNLKVSSAPISSFSSAGTYLQMNPVTWDTSHTPVKTHHACLFHTVQPPKKPTNFSKKKQHMHSNVKQAISARERALCQLTVFFEFQSRSEKKSQRLCPANSIQK